MLVEIRFIYSECCAGVYLLWEWGTPPIGSHMEYGLGGTMKIKGNFVLRKIGTEYFALSVGELEGENISIGLNETGAFLWQLLSSEISYENILKRFLDCYDIDLEVAKNDIDNFIVICRENGLLEGE